VEKAKTRSQHGKLQPFAKLMTVGLKKNKNKLLMQLLWTPFTISGHLRQPSLILETLGNGHWRRWGGSGTQSTVRGTDA
jgi:hypothetical protein